MSALRISVGGQPTRFIDMGPANSNRGRSPFDAARGAVAINEMVPFVGAAYIATNAELARGRRRAEIARTNAGTRA